MRNSAKKGSLAELAQRWVHASVMNDQQVANSHAVFIGSHLVGGMLALLVFPLWLAINQAVTAFEAGVFFWLVAPIGLAAWVSRTARLDWGVYGSILAFSGFVAWFSILTGGVSSAALLWFCLIPVEAALFGGRKTVLVGLAAALAGYSAVIINQIAQPYHLAQGVIGSSQLTYHYLVFAALIYGSILAFRVDRRRRHSSAKIVAEEGKFKLLADNSSDLITLHLENGDTQFASSASHSLLNCDPFALNGDGLFKRVHLHDRIAFKTALLDAAKTGTEVSVAYRIHVASGDGSNDQTTLWLETRCRKIFDPVTGAVEIVAVSRDISAIKETEAELNQQRSEAERSSEAKSRFLANMSHELRTPLNAIIGFSDILKQDLFGKFEYEKHSEYANLINDSGYHLLNLVNDILDISKIEAGRYDICPEPFDLPALVSKTCAMLSTQAMEQKVSISSNVSSDLPELNADSRACRQIITNLLSNAIKFSHEGSTVSISVKTVGSTMQLRVEDHGIGIKKDYLDVIGQPFFQIENNITRNFEGTGLGLFLVKGLVELHNGSFLIESELDKGTVVTIGLPMDTIRSRPVPSDESQTLVHLNVDQPTATPSAKRSKIYARLQARN